MTVSNNLSWSTHTIQMCAKATRTLGLIIRVCSKDIVDQENRKLLYITLVRSQLEYASNLWSAYTIKERALIENVQRKATKFILNHYNRVISYKGRLLKFTCCHLNLGERSLISSFYININVGYLTWTLVVYTSLFAPIIILVE